MIVYRRCLSLLVMLAALLPLYISSAQEQTILAVTQVDTSAYPQVRVSIAAPSGTLPAPDTLQISEDGRAIPPGNVQVASRRAGVAVAILIDVSRSMRGRGLPDSGDRLQDARDQAITLARNLDVDTDLISIFAFHRDVVPVLPLTRVDGGAVANTITTAPVLGPIPEKPGGAGKTPTEDDLRNDERAFSAFSQAVGRAITELRSPQTSDAYIRDTLPLMQKVIVVLSDSCDDTLDARDSKTCSIPVDVQTKLQDVVRAGDLSIFSVGLGTTDQKLAGPKPPQRAEAGFLYTSRFELLQLYAQQVPNSHFFQLFTPNADQAQTVRGAFATQVIEPIIRRGDQIQLTYTSQVGSVGQQRRISLSDKTLRVSAEFEEPRIPPSVSIVNEPVENLPALHPKIIYSQSPLARVDYYVDDSSVSIPGDPPTFSLNLSQVAPGPHRFSLEATDQSGERSKRSDTVSVDVPKSAPPPMVALPDGEAPTPSNQINRFLLNNIVSLITLLLVIILAIVVLVNPRGRAAATQMTNRVTGVIQRMTRPISATSSINAAADYLLVVRQGPGTGTEYPLASLNTYVGADPSLVDLVLSDPHVSGRHATINREGDDLYVSDLGSTNGTYINKARLTPNARTQLRAQDMLMIGGVTFECVWRGAAPVDNVGQGNVAQQPTVAYTPGQNGKL
ncbi:MAG: FHA domain-containing protein [Chloroflexales bacterium]